MKILLRIATFCIPVSALILMVFQVVVSNQLGTLGKQLGQIEGEILVERDIQQVLETQVASQSALLSVRERAINLGFIEPSGKQIVNLTPEVPVAYGANRLPIE